MKFINRIAITAAALCSVSGAASAAPLITNGSFEQGANPGVFTTLKANSTAITGWTVGNTVGGIDYIGSYWQAADGSRSLDLAGLGRGSIYQDVNTSIGKLYTLSFALAGNPDGQPLLKMLSVSIEGADSGFFSFLNTPLTTRQNMGWTTYTYDFVATQAVSRITFAALTSNADRTSPFGPALDNVSLTGAVPEPATWAMMLLGFGMVGFGLRRRAKTAVRVTYA